MSQQLPPRVYWVRRAVVLLGLAVLLLVVGLLLRALIGGGSDAAAPTPGARSTAPTGTTPPPATTAPAAPAPTTPATTHPGGIADCAAGDLAVTIVPSAASFAAGVSPTFTLTITSNGAAPCLVDAGDTHRAIVITSGTDRIWSNQDCAPANADARTLLLAPKQTDTTQLAWNRVRSAAGCPEGLPAPGAGTYVASFTVGGATAAPAAFTLG
jgi:hypothetical protein